MRECGAAVPPSPLPGGRLRYDASGGYLDAVRAALHSASGALLRLMLGQGQLMGWLRSIKHFFLLDQVGRGGGDSRVAERACWGTKSQKPHCQSLRRREFTLEAAQPLLALALRSQ
jgi:hypothetical protein